MKFNQDESTKKKKTNEILIRIIWIESQDDFIIMYQTAVLLKH